MPRRAAASLVALLLAACGSAAPDSRSGPDGGPPGIVVVTAGGTALQDGSDDVPPTLDLRVATGGPATPGMVRATLDGGSLPLQPSGDGLVARTPAMPLGSAHHLDLDVAGRSRQQIGFHVVGPAAAAAAVHLAPGGATVLDVAFALAPDRAAVEAALPAGGRPAWVDAEHLRASWPAAPAGRFAPAAGIATARGSHLAAGLDLALAPPPPGGLRRAVTEPTAPVPVPAGSLVVAFSVGTALSRDSVAAHAAQISVVSPTGISAGADGGLAGAADPPTVAAAGARGVPVWPLVQNRDFDTAAASRLLRDPAAVDRLVSGLRALAAQPGLGGIALDFEDIDPADRDALTGLVRRLADGLHADHHRLAVAAVPHKPGHLNAYSAAYDLPAIAAAADLVAVMAYEEHGAGTGPGAVDGLAWVEQVLAGTLPDLVPARSLLGLSLYARQWSAGDRFADSYAAAVAAALQDPAARVDEDFAASAPLIRGGNGTLTYFDDALSLAPKLGLVGPRGLAGLAVWRLGFEDPALWGLLPAAAVRPG